MLFYILRRLLYAIPIALAVSAVCFSLVYIAPGDPLNAIVPADASRELIDTLKKEYGLDKPIPVQYALWVGRAAQGNLGKSIATGRPVVTEIGKAISNTFIIAIAAGVIGFTLGALFGTIAGYTNGSWIDKCVSAIAIAGVSVPHYWLGMMLVVIFSVYLNVLPAMGAGAGGSADWAWDYEHMKFMILPALTLSAIPTGIVTRTLRALVADILSREFVTALAAKGISQRAIFLHVVKNAAPTALAVTGVQFG